MEKPISLIIEEAKIDYINAINEVSEKHKLNVYFVELIIEKIHNELILMRNLELENQKKELEKGDDK